MSDPLHFSAMAPADDPELSRKGRTPTGYVFEVPRTTDMFQTLLSPTKWGPAEILTIIFMSFQALSLPFVSILPTSFYVIIFAFWRASYNVGLAKLLHIQSNKNAITNWVQTCSPSARALINWAATKSMSQDYAWQRFPPSLNAWLAFRALSMVVLSNDGFSYAVLALSSFTPISSSSFIQLAVCIPLGSALFFLSFWSKAAAHHVLGDFAWYWGDFFFTVDGALTFEGVFELFPHPMYTVGYSAYYGAALICRSYLLFAVSLIAHISQLLFLAFVEEPHIQKIYSPKPSSEAIAPTTCEQNGRQPRITSSSAGYDAFTNVAPSLFAFPVLAFLFFIVSILAVVAKPPISLAVILLLVFRVFHWTGISFFLQRPDEAEENRWMKRHLKLGYSRLQAYSSWQHVLLTSYMMNHVLFFITSASLYSPSRMESSFSKTLSLVLAGSFLITLAAVSMASCWNTIGTFGFFYGDFFVEAVNHDLKANGSFRYVTNPQATLGYLLYYGLALVIQSRVLFMLAIACQAMELLFIDRVESVHIRKKYGQARRNTALEDAAIRLPLVSAILKLMRACVICVLKVMEGVKETHGESLKREMTVRKERFEANLSKSLAKARDHHIERRTQELKNRAESMVGELSCDNLVSALANRGIVVERVSQPITEPELTAASR